MEAKFKQAVPVLMVEDLDVAMKFFTEQLGFKVSFTSEWDYAGVSRGELEVHIGKGKPTPTANKGASIYFMVENIDALREEFVASGAIAADAQVEDQPYGLREIHLYDPSGYHLAFAEPKPQ